MKPSIGRIVWYYRNIEVRRIDEPELRPFPAIILAVKPAEAYVNEASKPTQEIGSRCDLQVFGYMNSESSRHGGWNENILFSPTPKDGCWSWPIKSE